VTLYAKWVVVQNNTTPPVVVTPPTTPPVTVTDPFVHPGNSGQAITNNPGNALNAITLNGSALNKYNKWMAQVSALLAKTPDGLASSLTGKDLTQYNSLIAKINDLVGTPSTPASTTTANKTNCGLKDAVINASDVTINAGDSFNFMKGVTAKDDAGKGADLTKKVTVSGIVNTQKVGVYSLTYSVKGCNGNKVSKTITLNVK